MVRFASPLCSSLPHPNQETPISQVTSIIDIGDASLRQLWSLRNHLQEASQLANANYPETLGPTLVVNCPSFFATVWEWVKGWFDPGTQKKIYILGGNPGKTIFSLIDPENVPECYGGTLKWAPGDPPALDDDAKRAIGAMPRGPYIVVDGKVVRPKEYVPPGGGGTANGTANGNANGSAAPALQNGHAS